LLAHLHVYWLIDITKYAFSYAGQAVGLIVADTFEHALEAAKAVEITYTNKEPLVLNIRDALSSQKKHEYVKRGETVTVGLNKDKTNKKSLRQVQGEFEMGSQYHFHMETQSCIVRPIENGEYEVIVSTQWVDGVTQVVASVLGIKNNRIHTFMPRVGGAYGGKVYKPSYIAAASAVAANKLKKPIRLVLDLQTNMEYMGKRCPYYFEYTVMNLNI
jgi:xanthine dehydrogenase/oxidase